MIRAIELAHFPFFSLVETILATSCNSPSSIFSRASTALLYWLNACSTAVARRWTPPATHRSDPVSVENWKTDQSQKLSSAALCRCLGPQYCDRSFGRHVVRKVARGGTCDRTNQKRYGFKSRTCNHLKLLAIAVARRHSNPSLISAITGS